MPPKKRVSKRRSGDPIQDEIWEPLRERRTSYDDLPVTVLHDDEEQA